jgi:hypothetical protein
VTDDPEKMKLNGFVDMTVPAFWAQASNNKQEKTVRYP